MSATFMYILSRRCARVFIWHTTNALHGASMSRRDDDSDDDDDGGDEEEHDDDDDDEG